MRFRLGNLYKGLAPNGFWYYFVPLGKSRKNVYHIKLISCSSLRLNHNSTNPQLLNEGRKLFELYDTSKHLRGLLHIQEDHVYEAIDDTDLPVLIGINPTMDEYVGRRLKEK